MRSHDNPVKFPLTGKRQTKHTFLKRLKRKTWGTTDQSVSPLCPDPHSQCYSGKAKQTTSIWLYIQLPFYS